MGQDSGIQWTNHTFNPWTRCTKVSPACDNCYAETWANRATHPKDASGKALPLWGADAPRTPTTAHNWRQPVKWNHEAQAAGVQARVFCASLADVFEDHPVIEASGARERLFTLAEATPWLNWLMLTKRPENMVRFAPASWAKQWPGNVWAGTTVESQAMAEERIPHLLKVPASVRFLSMEPLLGAVDLDLGRCDAHGRDHVRVSEAGEHCGECSANGWSGELSFGHWLDACADVGQAGVNWIIVGGESGSKARPFDVDWARSLVAQGRTEGVPVFMKQFGAHVRWNGCSGPGEHWPEGTKRDDNDHVRDGLGWHVRLKDGHGGDMVEWPEDLRVREFPR